MSLNNYLKIRTTTVVALLFLLVIILVSCRKMLPPAPESEDILAEPLEGLTADQLKVHSKGDAEFARVFAEADGLGPIFVATSCEGCHIGDGKGHPFTTLTRFNKFDGVTYNSLLEKGGPQLQHRAISGYQAEMVPPEATGMSKLIPPAVSGFGYLAGVADADILALADPNDADGDGISGVPHYISPPAYFYPQSWHVPDNGKYIGRFGRKAGAIDLIQQTANAYLNDMGITSDFNMQDLYNVQVGMTTGDNVPDPEVSASTVHNIVFYLRTLKAPPTRDQDNPDVITGKNLFSQTGCNKCHVPELKTGPSDIEALNNKTFYPYTDLLLHDMGSGLDDGYTEGSAASSEWRTTPLWGLGLSQYSQGGALFLMHDGRAKTFEEAISFHGGEGSSSRAQFQSLGADEKEKLVLFLKSL